MCDCVQNLSICISYELDTLTDCIPIQHLASITHPCMDGYPSGKDVPLTHPSSRACENGLPLLCKCSEALQAVIRGDNLHPETCTHRDLAQHVAMSAEMLAMFKSILTAVFWHAQEIWDPAARLLSTRRRRRKAHLRIV